MTKFARWLLFLMALMFLCAKTSYAITVTNTPSSTANCTNVTGIGTKAWSRPGNAFSSNNKSATRSLGTGGTVTSNYLKCVNYGFAIPTGATINGITVSVLRKTSKTTSSRVITDAAVYAVKGGVIGGTNLKTATAYTTTLTLEAHGGVTNLWGQTWTAADINAATFGAAFAAIQTAGSRSATASVDVISITVDYSDGIPPVVNSITLAGTTPTAAATVSWNVTFSKSVTGVDATDFSLIKSGLTGTPAITAVTGSGTSWTVTASTGSGSGTLGLNLNDNDSIVDASGNKLGGTGTGTAGAGGTGNGSYTGAVYAIDRINPVINSINRVTATPTNATSLQWTVVFSEIVTGVDATDFATALTGSVSNGAISVTGSGTTYTVTVAGISGAGSIGLNLVDNDSIVDATTNNKLGGTGTVSTGNGSATGQVYIYDRVAPSVVSITCDAASAVSSNTATWTVTFSEPVTGVATSNFSLVSASGLAGTSILSPLAGSGDTWSVTADTGYGAGTLGLNLANGTGVVDIPMSNALSPTTFTGSTCTISSTPPLAAYRMDESSWNGTTDEVLDQQGGYPGTAQNSATTADGSRALTGDPGTCRYGLFYNASSPTITKGYVDLSVDFPYRTDDFTIAGWIRTTSNSTKKQWIFTHNTGGKGYALSLGDAGTGQLRFVSGSTPTNLDSPSTALANNTWYFVAAVADFSAAPSVMRKLYVFDASGTLLSGYPVSVAASDWDGGEAGAASIGGDGSNSFRGNLDEIQIFDKVLNQAALTSLAKARHPCTVSVPDHYELSLPASSITCLPSTVTVTACADTSRPCTNVYTSANGATATLATSGATLGISTLTFDATGVATTTLSYPAATDGVSASVTLSGESISATNARTCCANGTSCTVANSCSSTFNTAGLIFSATANGAVATIPSQVAGVSSGTYYLRSVKTIDSNSHTCGAAFTGAQTINFAYECNNPTTCYGANMMSVNGGSAVTIARNNNASVATYSPLDMSFDSNGNASFTFVYSDVGQVTLWANKTVNSAVLKGSSNAFVVKPFDFGVVPCAASVSGACSTAPADPGLAGGGAVFARAGEVFKATVTARAAGGAATPSFGLGSNNGTEKVNLTRTRLAPSDAGAVDGTLAGTIAIPRSAFNSGIATVSDLSWSEVGVMTLTATNSTLLGSVLTTTGTSANVGRFYPDHFDTSIIQTGTSPAIVPMLCPSGLLAACPVNASGANGMVYSGQTFAVQAIAKNAGGTTTQNYHGAFAKAVTLSASASNGGALITAPSPGGTLSANTVAATAFVLGSNSTSLSYPVFKFATAPTLPTNIFIRSDDSDLASSKRLINPMTSSVEGGVAIVSGRIKMPNVYGSELLALPMTATVQYYKNGADKWVTSLTDSVTFFNTSTDMSAAIIKGPLASVSVQSAGSVTVANGQRVITLNKPGITGSADISLTTPSYLMSGSNGAGVNQSTTGRATFGIYKSPLIYRRENY